MNWKYWVIDITRGKEPYCFCPVDNDGNIIYGMNYISDRAPGIVEYIIHDGGSEYIEKWKLENQDWQKKYSKL